MPPPVFDPTTWQIEDWKRITWGPVTESGIVCQTPAFLFSAALTEDGSGNAVADVYDGHLALATLKHVHLMALANITFQKSWNPPLYFSQGIFVDLGTNALCVNVQYLPWSR